MRFSWPFVFIVMLLVVSLAYWITPSQSPESPDIAAPETEADYFFSQVTTTRYDVDGKPMNRLHAEKIEHYKAENVSVLKQPHLQISDKVAMRWLIDASQGTLDNTIQQLQLDGEVSFQRTSTTENDPADLVQIKATALTIDMQQNRIASEHPVTLTTADTLTRADRLNADLKSEQIQLQGNVMTNGIQHDN